MAEALDLTPPEPPLTDPLITAPRNAPQWFKEALAGGPSWTWAQFFLGQNVVQQQTPQRISLIHLTAQSASIGITNIPLPALPSGLYRLSTYVRVTTADGVSSSILTTIHSTDGSVPCSQSTPAYAGNDVSKPQSATFNVWVDATTPISYETTYVSGGGGPAMVYTLIITLEAIGG